MSALKQAESPEELDELIWLRCATDTELFSVLYFPHYCKRAFNPFHDYVFKNYRFAERDVRRADAAPRGSAKSTIKVLIKPIHDVCYGLEKFILVLSSNAALANAKLKDIRHEVFTNPGLRSVYGLRFKTKKPGESEFTVFSDMGSTHFKALGKGSQVRGIRVHEDRPTKILFDDVEHSEEVQSEEQRAKDFEWYSKDVVESGDKGTNIEFVGTVLHPDSLLKKLLNNPSYEGRTFKAIIKWSPRRDLWDEWEKVYQNIDNPNRKQAALAYFEERRDAMLADTQVLWNEKDTYYDHMENIQEGGLSAFMQEKQNDPMGSSSRMFKELHWFREVPEGLLTLSSGSVVPWKDLQPLGSCDPATGKVKQRGLGDWSVIPTGYKSLSGKLFIFHDYTARVPTSRLIQEIFDLEERFKYDKFVMETNMHKDLIIPNLEDERKRRKDKAKLEGKPNWQIDVDFYECENRENKPERIARLEPKVKHGHILFNKTLSSPFIQMFENYPNVDHDDAPDAVDMLWNLAHNRYKPSQLPGLVAMRGR